LVDSQGLLMEVTLTAADVDDRRPVFELLQTAQRRYPRLGKVLADKGYRGPLHARIMNHLHIRFSIEQRSQYAAPTQVLSARWVVERAFAWLGRYRRLSKDYEFLTQSSRAFIFLAMSSLVLRRLALF
jgi:putative transposase